MLYGRRASMLGCTMRGDAQTFPRRVALLYTHLRSVLSGVVVATGLTVAVLWTEAERPLLLGWAAAQLALTVVRAFGLWRFHRASPTEVDLPRWAWLAVVGSGLSGLLWAFGGAAFLGAHSVFELVTVVILLCGMVAGSVASLSVHPVAYVVYAVPVMGALAWALYGLEGFGSYWLASLPLAFLAVNLSYARTMYRTVVESIRLRQENLELVSSLRRQRDRAEQASLAKSKFLAAASHDLRQPMHALGLLADALKRKASETTRPIADQIVASTESLEQLLDGLLDISKLDAGAIEPRMRPVALRPILAAATRSASAGSGARFELQCPVDLGARTDPVLLRRIVGNLADNAVRHGASPFELTAREDDGVVEVRVVDHGPGVPEDERDNVFAEFHQLRNPERDRRKGLGLGLAIVRRLAELLDHSIQLRPTEGGGATFLVRLPAAIAPTASEVTPSSPGRSTPVVGPILVIDDEVDVREAMRTVLEGWGFEVLTAGDPAAAVAEAEQCESRVSLVIADHRLRGERTGVDAIDAVREVLGHQVPALIVTGDTAPDRIVAAQGSGIPILHKPVRPGRLRVAVEAAMAEWERSDPEATS